MCGIWGTSRLTELTYNLGYLLSWEMMSRGRDSWGCSDGSDIVKRAGPIAATYELPPLWKRAIVHTRAATQGSAKTAENAHPFRFQRADGSVVIGIHNGVIRDHDGLNRRYDRNFEVDSMHIYANIAEDKGLKDLAGYAAIAWYDGGELWLARHNSDNLKVATLETGELVFCSTEGPIRDGVTLYGGSVWEWWKIEEGHKYRVKLAGDGETKDTLLDYGKMEFGGQYAAAASFRGNRSHTYTPPPAWREPGAEVCYMCRQGVPTKGGLLCGECFVDAVRDYKAVAK